MLLAVCTIEVLTQLEAGIDLELVRSIWVVVLALDYAMVACSKGISTSLAIYVSSCTRCKQSESNLVPAHVLAIKYQNLCFGSIVVWGVYVIPAMLEAIGEDDLSTVMRMWTYLYLGIHHIIGIGFGAN